MEIGKRKSCLEDRRKPGGGVISDQIEIKGLVHADSKYSQRLMIGVGLTGNVRAEWMLARYGQIIPCNWQQVEFAMWIDSFAPLGYLVADWRNLAVRELLKGDFEWMVFIDHDTVIPRDFLLKLNQRIIKENVPVWSGLYFTKSYPSEPLLYRGKGTGFFANWKMGDQVWVNAIPMGCTVIHASILKAMWDISPEYQLGNPQVGQQIVRRVFESPREAWEDPITHLWSTRTGTEDLDWCWRLIENGIFEKAGWPKYQKKKYPFLVDTSIFCRHINPDGVMYPSRGEEGYFMK